MGMSSIRIIDSSNTRAVTVLLERAPRRDAALERRVARIVDGVRVGGDRAVRRYAEAFDTLEGPIVVAEAEIREAVRRVPRQTRDAVRVAARNIRHVARRQVPRRWRT